MICNLQILAILLTNTGKILALDNSSVTKMAILVECVFNA